MHPAIASPAPAQKIATVLETFEAECRECFLSTRSTPSEGQIATIRAIASLITAPERTSECPQVICIEHLQLEGHGLSSLLYTILPVLQKWNWSYALDQETLLHEISYEKMKGGILPWRLGTPLPELNDHKVTAILHNGFTEEEILTRWDAVLSEASRFGPEFSRDLVSRPIPEVARASFGSLLIAGNLVKDFALNKISSEEFSSCGRAFLVRSLGPLLCSSPEEITAQLARFSTVPAEQLSQLIFPPRLPLGESMGNGVKVRRELYQGREATYLSIVPSVISSLIKTSLASVSSLRQVLDLAAGNPAESSLCFMRPFAAAFPAAQFDCVDLASPPPSLSFPPNVRWHTAKVQEFLKSYALPTDAVILSRALHYFSPKEMSAVLETVAKVLSPDGIMVVCAYVDDGVGGKGRVLKANKPGIYSYGINAVPRLFAKAGFSVAQTIDFDIVHDGTGRSAREVYDSGFAVSSQKENREVRCWVFKKEASS